MQRSLTMAQAIWPQNATWNSSPARWMARNITLAVGFSLFIGLLAHAQIKLGFTPVPITGQTFGVLLAGALLGPRLGVATLLLYLAEGFLGLPVFASAASLGSFGYLIGFVIASGVVGYLSQLGWDRKPAKCALMMLIGSVIIYIAGVCWLQGFVHGYANAIKLGVLPFLIGDSIKAAAAIALLPLGWKLLGKSYADQTYSED